MWKKAKFWNRVRNTFALLGSATTSGLLLINVADGWVLFSAIMTFIGSLVGIWFGDDDDNGVVDILEDN